MFLTACDMTEAACVTDWFVTRSAPGDSNVADASGRLNAAPSAPKQKSTTAGHPDDAELIPITTDTAELNGALEQETEQ